MKKLLLGILFAASSMAWAQTKTCCSLSSVTAKNTEMAMNTDFAATHSNPLAYTLESPKGEMVEFSTKGGKTAKAYFLKTAKKSKKYLFVFHEWWGLNDHIKKEAEKYFEDLKDVNVLAIDLYDGKVASTREEAQLYMSGMDDALARAIVNGAFVFAGKKANIATLGWCFGGTWSLQAAIEGGNKVDACVMYYGFPEMNVEKLKLLDTDILGIFAEKDAFINVETVKAFEGKVKEAGKEITVYNYVAVHAFANPSNPNYNKQASEDAHNTKVMPYLRLKMKLKAPKS
jgi:carboxymethylenebutenolidase